MYVSLLYRNIYEYRILRVTEHPPTDTCTARAVAEALLVAVRARIIRIYCSM